MRNKPIWTRFMPLWAPNDGGTPPAGDAPPADPPAAPPAGDTPAVPPSNDPPAAKWFENNELMSAEEREWLTARGLNLDDPLQAIPKLVRGHRSAEKHIGRGVDKIIERPGDGQAYSEWARANATALGLPEAADGYEIAKPESWPQDATWDSDFEAQFRTVAFEEGLPPAAVNRLVGIYADKIKGLNELADQGYERANAQMMTDLNREFGEQVPAVLARAQQGAQAVAQAAGMDMQAVEAITARLSKDSGDAQVIKFMAKIGEMMGEDNLLRANGGQQGLGATRADAEAALSEFMKPDGEWAKASATRDTAAINRLRPKFDQLTKAVAGFGGK